MGQPATGGNGWAGADGAANGGRPGGRRRGGRCWARAGVPLRRDGAHAVLQGWGRLGSGKRGSVWGRLWGIPLGLSACRPRRARPRPPISIPRHLHPSAYSPQPTDRSSQLHPPSGNLRPGGRGLDGVSSRVARPAARFRACLLNLGRDCTDSGASGVASRITDLATVAISNKDPRTHSPEM